jgi:hypothetical protein
VSGFVFEFHLPDFALRQQERPLTKPHLYQHLGRFSNDAKAPEEGAYFHEAQISLLVFGPDEYFWTANCFVDTYFQSEESIEQYKSRGDDAPTGGAQPVNLPYWDPREYVLTVLARRIEHVTMEWRNIIAEVKRELKVYVSTRFTYGRLTLTTDLANRNAAYSNPATQKVAVLLMRSRSRALTVTTE